MARRTVPMESGERDKQVTVQQLTESDEPGFPGETWSTLVTMAMARFEVSGGERFRASQLSSPYETRWECNYRADLDPDLVDVPKRRRLLYKTRVHDIVQASIIGQNEGIEFLTLANTGQSA